MGMYVDQAGCHQSAARVQSFDMRCQVRFSHETGNMAAGYQQRLPGHNLVGQHEATINDGEGSFWCVGR